MTLRLAVLFTVGAVGLALGGCSSAPVEISASRHPPTVTLPLSLSGVRDERARFAAVFADELGANAKASGPWLHGVPSPLPVNEQAVREVNDAFRARAGSTSVLIVPGLFDDCFDDQSVPFGDGRQRTREQTPTEAYAQYADLGLAGLRSIPLPGRRSSAANGRLVAEQIRIEAARSTVKRIIVFGYSKGTPDSLHAIAELQRDGLPEKLAALVSVAGVVVGSPYADQFQRVFEALSPHIDPLACSTSDGKEIASLTRRERVAWLVENPLPARLRYYSVVAFAPSDEVGLVLRPFHLSLAAVDPRNDGQLLATDAVLPGSALLAEARADHWDVALPRDRHPNWVLRSFSSGRNYPREALFRALVKWVVADGAPLAED